MNIGKGCQELLLPHAGALFEPVEVGGGIGGECSADAALNGWTDGVGDLPAMAGDVAVSVGEIGCAVVIGGRKIAPGVIVEAIDEEAVVDGVGMFVEKDKGVGRISNVGSFEELDVIGVEFVGEFARVTDHCIHGHAADAGTVSGWRFVGRTFVNRGRTVGVRAELGIGEIDEIRVVVVVGPVFDVVGPGLAAGDGLGFAVVIDEEIVVIVRVKGPGERELFDVVGALRGFGAGFGFAQSGEEEAGQNRNDSDNYEQFDQGEGQSLFGRVEIVFEHRLKDNGQPAARQEEGRAGRDRYVTLFFNERTAVFLN